MLVLLVFLLVVLASIFYPLSIVAFLPLSFFFIVFHATQDLDTISIVYFSFCSIIPIIIAYLSGLLIDNYVLSSFHRAKATVESSTFSHMGLVLAAYCSLQSDVYFEALVPSFGALVASLAMFLKLANEVVLIATFISVILIVIVMFCETPFRWLQAGISKRVFIPISSLRPLMAFFIIALSLHVMIDFVEFRFDSMNNKKSYSLKNSLSSIDG